MRCATNQQLLRGSRVWTPAGPFQSLLKVAYIHAQLGKSAWPSIELPSVVIMNLPCIIMVINHEKTQHSSDILKSHQSEHCSIDLDADDK